MYIGGALQFIAVVDRLAGLRSAFVVNPLSRSRFWSNRLEFATAIAQSVSLHVRRISRRCCFQTGKRVSAFRSLSSSTSLDLMIRPLRLTPLLRTIAASRIPSRLVQNSVKLYSQCRALLPSFQPRTITNLHRTTRQIISIRRTLFRSSSRRD